MCATRERLLHEVLKLLKPTNATKQAMSKYLINMLHSNFLATCATWRYMTVHALPCPPDLSSDLTIFVGVQVFEGSCSDLWHVDLVDARLLLWKLAVNKHHCKNIERAPFQTACSCTVGAWTELRLPSVKQEASFWTTLMNSEFCVNKIRIALFGGEQNCFRRNASSHLLLWFFCLVHLVLWCNMMQHPWNRF